MRPAGRGAALFTVSLALIAGWTVQPPGGGSPASAAEAPAGAWAAGAVMSVARHYHTATVLQNGKVLVTGGQGRNFALHQTAEIYDPSNGSWSPTGSMLSGRERHTATLLSTGEVLVAGGFGPGGQTVNPEGNPWPSQIYDPGSGQWRRGPAPREARASHTATLLDDGTVLVVGGTRSGPGDQVEPAEVYERSAGPDGGWTDAGRLTQGRLGHTATLVDGDVLVVGGDTGLNDDPPAEAERFDPDTRTWAAVTGPANGAVRRQFHSATRLHSGKVLLAAGELGNGGVRDGSALIYDRGTWSNARTLLQPARKRHPAALLTDGKVFVNGGQLDGAFGPATNSSALFDPQTEGWTPAPASPTARIGATATVLEKGCGARCGKVLVVGGTTTDPQDATAVRAVDVYTPAPTLRAITPTPGDLLTMDGFGLASVQKVTVAAGSGTAEVCGPATQACAFDRELPDSRLTVKVAAQQPGSVVNVTVFTEGGDASLSYTYTGQSQGGGGGPLTPGPTTPVTTPVEEGTTGTPAPPGSTGAGTGGTPATPGGSGGGTPAGASVNPAGGSAAAPGVAPADGGAGNAVTASSASPAAPGVVPPPAASAAVGQVSAGAVPAPAAGAAHVAVSAQVGGNGAVGDVGDEAADPATRYTMDRAGPDGVPAAALAGAALLMVFTCALLFAGNPGAPALADARSKGAY